MIVSSLLIIIIAGAYFILHSYFNKLNLIHKENSNIVIQETKDYESSLNSIQNDQNKTNTSTPATEGKSNTDKVDAINEIKNSYGVQETFISIITSNDNSNSENKEMNGSETNLDEKSEQNPNSSKNIITTKLDENQPEYNSKHLDEQISQNLLDHSQIPYDVNVINILLIGSNTRYGNDDGMPASIGLMTIKKELNKIITITLSRDIYVNIPDHGNNKLSTAYVIGGAPLLVQCIQNNFKIKINYFFETDIYTMIDLVDSINGITVDVQEDELEIINANINQINILQEVDKNKDCLTKAGTQLLNGKQTFCYTKNRNLEKGNTSRMKRQQQVISLIYSKMLKQNLLNINDFLNMFLPKITTNLTEAELISQLFVVPTYMNYTIDAIAVPVSDSYEVVDINNMKVFGIDFKHNINVIHKKLYE